MLLLKLLKLIELGPVVAVQHIEPAGSNVCVDVSTGRLHTAVRISLVELWVLKWCPGVALSSLLCDLRFLCGCSCFRCLLLLSWLWQLIFYLFTVHLCLECESVGNALCLGYLQNRLWRNEIGFVILASVLVLVCIADDVSALEVDVFETLRHVCLDFGATWFVARVRRRVGRRALPLAWANVVPTALPLLAFLWGFSEPLIQRFQLLFSELLLLRDWVKLNVIDGDLGVLLLLLIPIALLALQLVHGVVELLDLCLHALSFLVQGRDLGLHRLRLWFIDAYPGLKCFHSGLQMAQVWVEFFWHRAYHTLLIVLGDIIRAGINWTNNALFVASLDRGLALAIKLFFTQVPNFLLMAGDRCFLAYLHSFLLLGPVLSVGAVDIVQQLPQLRITSAAPLASSGILNRWTSAWIKTLSMKLSLHNLRIAAAHWNLIDVIRVLCFALRTSLAL